MPGIFVVLMGVAMAAPGPLPSTAWLAAPPRLNAPQIKSVALLPVRAGPRVPKDMVKNIETTVAERLAALAPNMRVVVHPDFTATMGPGAVRAAQRCDKAGCLAKLATTFDTDSVMLVNLTQPGGRLQMRLMWVDTKRVVLGKRSDALGKHGDFAAAINKAITGVLGPGASFLASEPSTDPTAAPLDEIIGWLGANVKNYSDGQSSYSYDWSKAMADCQLTITQRHVDGDGANAALAETTLANAKLMDAAHFKVVQEGAAFAVQQDCPFACSDVVLPDDTKQQRKQVTVYAGRNKAVADRLMQSLARWATLCNPHAP